MPAEPASFDHGLVIGKFYPPHAGHHLLIDRAASSCRRVTVVVAAHPHETIPLAKRAAWLTAAHAESANVRIIGEMNPNPVDFGDPAVWARHVEVFAAAVTRGVRADGLAPTEARVDAVFSSEVYGEELARRLGAICIHVDVNRSELPVSGTQIRDDVIAGWPWLHPATKAGLALRIIVPDTDAIGDVASAPLPGAVSLAEWLGAALAARRGAWAATAVVPAVVGDLATFKLDAAAWQSAAREEAGSPGPGPRAAWVDGDFLDLAVAQEAAIDEAAAAGGPVVVAANDPLVTLAWFQRRLGPRGADDETVRRLTALVDARPADLYLLEAGRADGLAELLVGADRSVVILPPVAGILDIALAAIDDLVATSWRFADPLVGDPRDSLGLTRPRHRGRG